MAKVLAAALVAATIGGLGSAAAQEFSPDFDLAFGFAITSNYIDGGVSQSANGPAVQAYIEKTFGIAYAGIWASNVQFEDEGDVQVDLNVGVRPEWGAFEFDFGYTYTFYAGGVEDPGHSLHAAVEWEALEWLTLEKEVTWEITEGEWEFEGEGEIDLGNGFALFGGLGYALLTEPGANSYLFWQAGVSYTYADAVTLALSYSDTNLNSTQCEDDHDAPDICGPAFLATLSFDSSLSRLFGGPGGAPDLD